jgi:tRNA dimethylallyltransferase
MINPKENTVIVIVGPTAVGKTKFAIDLAKQLRTEIISADSRQCFQELNIAVAKPNAVELESIHHYFINSHSIHEEVNAGTFEQYALQSVNSIFKKNNVAVMVGGTGLYVKTFCEGIDEIPKADATIRKKNQEQYEANGLQWLQEEVQQKDPLFWETAEQQNPHRLLRALEVMEATGRSITTYHQQVKAKRPFNIIKVGLSLPKEELYLKINMRVDNMIEQGLVDEAKSLLPYRSLNALQTVGYKELFDFFDGKISLSKAVDDIKKNTRHYAKRQMTWFKKDETIQWIHPNESFTI